MIRKTRRTRKSVVDAFVKAINSHDADRLAALMSVNHVFVDSLGNTVKGREAMRTGWKSYFGMFPDYRISVEEVFWKRQSLVLLGIAEGTFSKQGGELLPKNMWKIPAAWKAVVKKGQIEEWRVFADNYKTARLLKND